VLDEVRRHAAENLLRDPHVSLTQIAFLLGYTEQSTFHNAFRRWTQVSPGVYRKRAFATAAGRPARRGRRGPRAR
jgi:AraC-like DNA-binding protein